MEQDTNATPPVAESSKQSNGKGWKIATAITFIIAICGVGFGIYGMAQSLQKDNQISDLKTQIEETDDGYHNQILVSSDPNKIYTINYSSPTYYPEGSVLTIALTDGAITYCRIGIRTAPDAIAYGEVAGARDCEIGGISKKIHRIVEFGSGHEYSFFNVGFIMEDGTVQYLPIQDALENGNFNAEKTLKIDGYVIGTIDPNVTVLPQGYGHRRTVFILNDGSFVGFDESMLQESEGSNNGESNE